jgi:hypothetical protein
VVSDTVDVEWDATEQVWRVPAPKLRMVDERGRVVLVCRYCGRSGIVEGASMDRHINAVHPDKVPVPPAKPPFWRRFFRSDQGVTEPPTQTGVSAP